MRIFILISLLFVCFKISYADAIRFKNLTKAELEITDCDFYPDAPAMILTQVRKTYFEITSFGSIYCNHDQGSRIKILSEEGKEYADVKIRYYSPEGNIYSSEKIIEINAVTYNLEDGKIVKTKLEKSSIYYTRLNKYWQEVSFAMPNVKTGSVIEYSYTKNSNRIGEIDDWLFQQPIPVLHSEVSVAKPDEFDFQAITLGEVRPIHKKETGSAPFGSLPTTATIYTLTNISPVEDEPFVANACDLPLRLKFILKSVRLMGMPIQHFALNYSKVVQIYMEDETLGKAINRGGFAKNIETVNAEMPQKEKADSIYEWIKRQMAWNDYYGVYQSKSFRSCLNEGKGSCADINLALTAAFRANGLEAYPVVLSTRGHGVPHPVYPSFDSFNYLITALSVDGQLIFYDATEDNIPGLLPVRCLNGQGLLLSETGGRLIELKNKGRYRTSSEISTKIENGEIIIDIGNIDKEYAAIETEDYIRRNGINKYGERIKNRYSDWELDDFSVQKHGKNILKTHFKIKQETNAGTFYLYPIMYGIFTTSPFKQETRKAVIDFPYVNQYAITSHMTVPEGYEYELPEVRPIILGRNDAVFKIDIIINENVITFNTQMQIRKTVYSSQEYPGIKEFFDKVAEATKCMVVLKKNKYQ